MRYFPAFLFLLLVATATTAEYRPLIMGTDGKPRQFPDGVDSLRVVPIAGTDAAKPTAAASNTGLMYFATDTNKIYRSTGAAWVLFSFGGIGSSAIGSTPNSDGLTISSGSSINLQPADASFGGVVTTGTQTFAGAKTFSSAVTGPGGVLIGGTLASGRVPFASGTATLTDTALFNYSATTGLTVAFGDLTNVTIGDTAGDSITSGSSNVLIGRRAGTALTTTQDTTAIGTEALKLATVAGNTALGAFSGPLVSTGLRNTLIGNRAGNALTTSSGVTLVGHNAGIVLAANDGSVFVGDRAGSQMAGGTNVGIGSLALQGAASASGTSNVAIGSSTLKSISTDNQNIAIGSLALQTLAGSSGKNTAVGYSAGSLTTTGTSNIFLGNDAGDSTAVSASNRFVVGSSTAPISSVFIGNGESLSSPAAVTINSSGGSGSNIAGAALNLAGGIGTGTGVGGSLVFRTAKAGSSGASANPLVTRHSILQDGAVEWTGIANGSAPAVSAASNGAIYYDTNFQSFRTSSNGVAYTHMLGGVLVSGRVPYSNAINSLTDSSLFAYSATTGLAVGFGGVTCVAVGQDAGKAVTSGANNTSIGNLAQTTISANSGGTAVGYSALTAATGANNTAVGSSAGASVIGGASNVFIGSGSSGVTTGNTNTLIGAFTTADAAASGCTTLGYNADCTGVSGTNGTAIGSNTIVGHDHSIALGAAAATTAANQFVVGSGTSQITDVFIGKGATSTTPAAVAINATGASGFNTSASSSTLRLAGGRGTGTGAGGVIEFQTAPAGGSSSTQNALVTRVTVDLTGNLVVNTVGTGLQIKEGTDAKMGTAVLVAGSKVVSTVAVTANSRIYLTSNFDGGTVGFLRVSARTAATSFTITSSSGADTSTVAWVIIEPSP